MLKFNKFYKINKECSRKSISKSNYKAFIYYYIARIIESSEDFI